MKYRSHSWWDLKGFNKDKKKHGRKFISEVRGFIKKLSHKKLRHLNRQNLIQGKVEKMIDHYSETGYLEPK